MSARRSPFTTKDVGRGNGLGLSHVCGFIKQSNGHIRLESELGRGTIVKLYLPRSLQDEIAYVRSHTTDLLRDLGYLVVEAADGPSALELLARETEIRLLFTDIGLPAGMNGRQLAAEARRRRPQLKVLHTTGYAHNANADGGFLDPGAELLTKPFTYTDPAEKMRSLLAN
jgi:CheY-like chemotaxis protein